MKGCSGIYDKSLIVVFISAIILRKYKEFKIFQASNFNSRALFLQQNKGDSLQSGQHVKKQIKSRFPFHMVLLSTTLRNVK